MFYEKVIFKCAFYCLILLCVQSPVLAQDEPPPALPTGCEPDPPPSVPLDKEIYFLAVAAIVLGYNNCKKLKKLQNNSNSNYNTY